MKWLVLDGYVAIFEQIIGQDIWNHMCHVRQSSQQRGLAVIKYFSMYGQCLRIFEDVSKFSMDWGKAMVMDPYAHGDSYSIDVE